jgi:hypothetical protein
VLLHVNRLPFNFFDLEQFGEAPEPLAAVFRLILEVPSRLTSWSNSPSSMLVDGLICLQVYGRALKLVASLSFFRVRLIQGPETLSDRGGQVEAKLLRLGGRVLEQFVRSVPPGDLDPRVHPTKAQLMTNYSSIRVLVTKKDAARTTAPSRANAAKLSR